MAFRLDALAFFKDPATGAPRLACGCRDGKVCVFNAVAGGEALLVFDAGSSAHSLAVFADPATGAPRLVTSSGQVFDPIAGGDALVVLEGGGSPLAVFTDPATGELRLACSTGYPKYDMRIYDPVTGVDALIVLEGHTDNVNALTAFADPATGETRLASGSHDKTLRLWDAITGAALRVVAFDDAVSTLVVRSDMSGLFVAFGKRWGELRVA